jgi:hypothetical protein
MANQDSHEALSMQIGRLLESVNERSGKPRWKDWLQALSILTPFLGTVVVAGIGLFVTSRDADRGREFQRTEVGRADREAERSRIFQAEEAKRARDFQQAESDRAARFAQAQIEIKHVEASTEQFKAMTTILPMLASRDDRTRDLAMQYMRAIVVNRVGSGRQPTPDSVKSSAPSTMEVIALQVVLHPSDPSAALALNRMNSRSRRQRLRCELLRAIL